MFSKESKQNTLYTMSRTQVTDFVDKRKNIILPIIWTTLIGYFFYHTYLSISQVRGWVSPKLRLFIFGYGISYSAIWLVVIGVFFFPDWSSKVADKLIGLRTSLKSWPKVFSIAFLSLPSWLVFLSPFFRLRTPTKEFVIFPHLRIFAFIISVAVSAFLMTESDHKLINFPKITAALLLSSMIFILVREFQTVVKYPFSLTWSEGNRMWDYSILYGRQRYNVAQGEKIFAFIDRGRQTLWGVAFLIPGLSIWGMRLWDAFLFTIPYAFLGWMVFERSSKSNGLRLFLGLWTFIFLNQGPVYTPLVVSAILVAGSRKVPFWMGLIFVFLAGYYAQLTRFTWMFAPAMWAGMWTLGRADLKKGKIVKKDWVKSVFMVIAGVFGGYIIPTLVKGGSSSASVAGVKEAVSHHPLLWSRLWPNPTYTPGIVLGLLIAAGPLLILLKSVLESSKWETSIWQRFALGFGQVAFLIVGLVVSVKMGGGSNLHNLDMFMIGLVFVTSIAWAKGGELWFLDLDSHSLKGIFTLISLFLLIYFPLVEALPMDLPKDNETKYTLFRVSTEVTRRSNDAEILFMDQRQLLTFGFVEQVSLVDEYEKKYVMNQAMGDNEAYFDDFYRDLAQNRFSLIVNEPLNMEYQKDDGRNFAEENNAWVYWVSQPMLCYYKPLETFKSDGVELLIPREDSSTCSYFFHR